MITLGSPEDCGSKPLQNVGTYVPIYVALYLRILEFTVVHVLPICGLWTFGGPQEIIQKSSNMTFLDLVDYVFLYFCTYCCFSNEWKAKWWYSM
jgi:hypothetical protein